jgi:hypothetical protein
MPGLAQSYGQNPSVRKRFDVVRKHQGIEEVGLRQKTLS